MVPSELAEFIMREALDRPIFLESGQHGAMAGGYGEGSMKVRLFVEGIKSG